MLPEVLNQSFYTVLYCVLFHVPRYDLDHSERVVSSGVYTLEPIFGLWAILPMGS